MRRFTENRWLLAGTLPFAMALAPSGGASAEEVAAEDEERS
ncbi:hypothetical protein [Novosphingobium guangzhouense]|nr:hypothetical protein [Novosphingobium guangzhouense]